MTVNLRINKGDLCDLIRSSMSLDWVVDKYSCVRVPVHLRANCSMLTRAPCNKQHNGHDVVALNWRLDECTLEHNWTVIRLTYKSSTIQQGQFRLPISIQYSTGVFQYEVLYSSTVHTTDYWYRLQTIRPDSKKGARWRSGTLSPILLYCTTLYYWSTTVVVVFLRYSAMYWCLVVS